MKKNKLVKTVDKKAVSPDRRSKPGYGAQDFDQGRGGGKGGHTNAGSNVFDHFKNKGHGSYAAERVVGVVTNSKGRTNK